MAPWANKTGLAKATAILATVLLISLGLCGANFLVVMSLLSYGGTAPGGWGNSAGGFLGVLGWTEVAAIVISIAGLVLVGVLALVSACRKLIFPQDKIDKEN